MSYSFNVKAATKAKALEEIDAELATVVKGQPMHEKDRPVAKAAAESVIGLLREDPEQDVVVSVSGWLSWAGSDADELFTAVNLSVSATLATKNTI